MFGPEDAFAGGEITAVESGSLSMLTEAVEYQGDMAVTAERVWMLGTADAFAVGEVAAV